MRAAISEALQAVAGRGPWAVRGARRWRGRRCGRRRGDARHISPRMVPVRTGTILHVADKLSAKAQTLCTYSPRRKRSVCTRMLYTERIRSVYSSTQARQHAMYGALGSLFARAISRCPWLRVLLLACSGMERQSGDRPVRPTGGPVLDDASSTDTQVCSHANTGLSPTPFMLAGMRCRRPTTSPTTPNTNDSQQAAGPQWRPVGLNLQMSF
jgi:hypothetical protein